MTERDWTLLVIAAAGDKPLQPVHLQKALFLVGKLLSDEQRRTKGFYTFEPYDYGPFCKEVYTAADMLCEEGLIQIQRSASYREYSATAAGIEKAKVLQSDLAQKVRDYLDQLVKWVSSLSFNQLVSWIYKQFPGMKVNSVFKE